MNQSGDESINRPEPIGSPLRAFDAAMGLLEKIGARSVLDCPAGRGAFTHRLLEKGFEVQCADILPEAFEIPGLECRLADLNKSLPFDDESFDAITCLNGLHRVWARGRAMREFARTLKPGGTLILTFVNNQNLVHRANFFLTGSVIHNTVGPPHVCLPDAEEPAAHFRYPMSVGHIASGLRSVGLKWGGMSSVGLSWKSIALAPLGLLPWAYRPVAGADAKEYCFLEHASKLPALFGDYLVVWGQKKRA